MGKKIIHDGPINTAVMAWMRGQGIKPEGVRGYTLTYDAGDVMRIDISMYMNDEAPKPANPLFVADKVGSIWIYDLPADGYRCIPGGLTLSLDRIKVIHGIAEFQPPHATCLNVTSPSHAGPSWVCGKECLKSWPARVIDDEGDEYRHQGDGVYRMALKHPYHPYNALGENTYTLDEIGKYSVVEE